jgi:hypothetical protein
MKGRVAHQEGARKKGPNQRSSFFVYRWYVYGKKHEGLLDSYSIYLDFYTILKEWGKKDQ